MEQDMLNGKPGSTGWKNKLDDVANLPGFMLQDKNASWGKLHSRLQEKPRRIGAAWYWAAASCILFVCSIPLFTATDKSKAIVKNDNLKNSATETRLKPGSLPEISKTIIAVEPAHHNTIVKHLPARLQAGKHAKTTKPANEKQTILPAPEPTYLTQAEIEKNPIENTLPEPIVAVPVKQKLKVVHINELGEPAPQRNADQGTDYSFIQIRLITQQVNTGTRATAKSIGFNISKSKATSTN